MRAIVVRFTSMAEFQNKTKDIALKSLKDAVMGCKGNYEALEEMRKDMLELKWVLDDLIGEVSYNGYANIV